MAPAGGGSPGAGAYSGTDADADTGAAESAPESALTLWDVLAWHVRTHPQRPHLTLLTDADTEETLDYATLARAAEAIGAGLQARGVQPGQTVAIMLPTCREYFTSFFGVLAAGAIPVPIYPPARAAQIEDHLRRHGRILVNARAAALITVPEARPLARLLRLQAPELGFIATADELTGATAAAPWRCAPPTSRCCSTPPAAPATPRA